MVFIPLFVITVHGIYTSVCSFPNEMIHTPLQVLYNLLLFYFILEGSIQRPLSEHGRTLGT